MKRNLISVFCILVCSLSFGQDNLKEYAELKKTGDSLYRVDDYKNSATYRSLMLNVSGRKPTIADRYSTACSWSLANYPDSAFYQLNIIAEDSTVSFEDFIDISDDQDFKLLHNDERWNVSMSKIFNAAKNSFSAAVRESGGKIEIRKRINAAAAWSLINQPDSAFYQLDLIAVAKDLKIAEINDIMRYSFFQPLYNDKRWPVFKHKIFENFATNTSALLNQAGRRPGNSDRRNAALAWTRANEPDSAFYQLNLIANSRDLTFGDAYNIIPEILDTRPFTDFITLHNDKRWQDCKDKMFSNLYNKYFPTGAFDKINIDKHILIDEGHHNYHTITSTYSVLAGVLSKCGFNVSGHKGRFDSKSLNNTGILIISNPAPFSVDSIVRWARANNEPPKYAAITLQPTFIESEVVIIEKWVRNGGSLLLILDHAPYPLAGSPIAAAFGIECRNVSTYDRLYRDPAEDTTKATTIIFTRSNGLIGKHPILNGVDSLTTYTGESVLGPKKSDALLLLPSTATDQDWDFSTKQFRYRSAAGRTQGVALEYGRGRVIVLGEAAMIGPDAISLTNRGNWQMTLNILRWLTGNLK